MSVSLIFLGTCTLLEQKTVVSNMRQFKHARLLSHAFGRKYHLMLWPSMKLPEFLLSLSGCKMQAFLEGAFA